MTAMIGQLVIGVAIGMLLMSAVITVGWIIVGLVFAAECRFERWLER